MFEVADRDAVAEALLGWAAHDPDVVAAGAVGSAARGALDRWSDVDLALRLAPGADRRSVIVRLTDHVARSGVVDTMDLQVGEVHYRVFLLANGLQVDVSFFPHDQFRASYGEPLLLHFGDALPPAEVEARAWEPVAASGWLYLIHARSAIGRGRWWQADLMLGEFRSALLWLAARSQGLNPDHGREAHLIDAQLLRLVADARPSTLAPEELRRAYAASVVGYRGVVGRLDEDLAARVARALG